MRSYRYGRKKLKKSFKRQLTGTTSEMSPFAHLRKTAAELIYDEGIGRAKQINSALVVLNELTPRGVQVFTEAPFVRFQRLTLNIPSLRNFFVQGRVVSCVEVPVSAGIVTDHRFTYRIGLEFQFQTEAEAKAVRDYCEQLRAAYFSEAA